MSDMSEEDRETLNNELQKYQKALESEFETKQKEQPEHVVENTLEYFQGHVPNACAQIIFMMQHSTSDATRLAASKYVIDRVFKGMVDSPEDPVKEILKKLMAGEPTTGVSPHED